MSQTKKKWIGIIVILCLIGAVAGISIYKSYRGLGLWNLRTDEVKSYQKTVQEETDAKVTVKYRAFQMLEIQCHAEVWSQEDIDMVLSETEKLLTEESFQKAYAQKYEKRYQCESDESSLVVAMLYFQKDGELLPVQSYSYTMELAEWCRNR